MHNQSIWHPSKFLYHDNGQLRANCYVNEVAVSSRLVADYVLLGMCRDIPQKNYRRFL